MIRKQTLEKFFPEESELTLLLSAPEVHSEDELDENDQQFRWRLSWRSDELDEFFHALDQLHIQTRLNPRSRTTAMNALNRGEHRRMTGLKELSRNPPERFPECLVSKVHLERICEGQELLLKLSKQEFQLAGLTNKAQRLCGL